MFYQILSYFKFLWVSKSKYKVHSPFVFNLITKCFENETSLKKRNIFKNYKHFLLANNTIINVTDFGAGSRVFKSNSRKISAIAKNAGIDDKRAFLLIQLVKYFNTTSILEIGTSLGVGTLALALADKNTVITTLEGCFSTVEIPKTSLKNYVSNNINYIVGDFKNTLKKAIDNQKYDLIYFDGNHQKEPTILYFEQCLKTIHNNTVFIFDDIHWSKDMEQAWTHIKDHEKVRLTIDTFYWGFVFFRKEQQQKEHFVLRI